MADANNKEQLLYQNLQDAGCTPEMIQHCMVLGHEHKTAELLRMLAKHRRKLLDQVHAHQKEIDCLDFLVYGLKKQKQMEETT